MAPPIEASERRRGDRRTACAEPRREEITSTILGSYAEMPGLTLHLEQAARLFGLRAQTCQVVLDDLVRAGRLKRRPDGQYSRNR